MAGAIPHLGQGMKEDYTGKLCACGIEILQCSYFQESKNSGDGAPGGECCLEDIGVNVGSGLQHFGSNPG